RLQQRFDESAALLEKSERTFQALVDENPTIPIYRGELAQTQVELMSCFGQASRPADGLKVAERAVPNAAKLAALEPRLRSMQVYILNTNANLLLDSGRKRDALAVYEQALAIEEEVFRADTTSIYDRSTVCRS